MDALDKFLESVDMPQADDDFGDEEPELWVEMDGERVAVESVDSDYLESFETEDGKRFYIFGSSEAAGEASVEHWRSMAEHDREELIAIIGTDVLVAWALGEWAGPGDETAQSFDDWLTDVVANHPEEDWATYDGREREIATMSSAMIEALGWPDDGQGKAVAYRCD